MNAYRHRLIFWPLFCGAVVYFFAGMTDDHRVGPGMIPAAAAVAFAFAAIYASDTARRGSGKVRVGVAVVATLAAVDLFTTGFLPGPDRAVLLLLLIFAVPLIRATRKGRLNARRA